MSNKELNLKEIKKMFDDTILKHLKRRDEDKGLYIDLYQPSKEDSFFPVYVMDMIKEINSKMPEDALELIKNAETDAMGHVDYFRKFSYRCAEIYLELKRKHEK